MFQRYAIFDPTKSRNQNKRGNGGFRSPTQSDPWLISGALLMMRHLLICSQWVLDQVVLVVDALVRFNKNVFVGLIFLGPTIGALVSTLLVLMDLELLDGILKPRIYDILSIRFRGDLAWVLRGCGGGLVAATYCRSEPQPMKKPLVGAVVGVTVREAINGFVRGIFESELRHGCGFDLVSDELMICRWWS
uniref:Uncharacterized protein n=1 Tax=Fagus sylvatica TaxID=28930 RepID=A0A2N9ICW7_FAGSY